MQTQAQSMIESLLNIGSGFFISLAVWVWIVVPVWNLPVRPIDNLGITGLFTVVSVIRSYVWRRIFNRIHKVKT
jgi:hypothetical protein